MITGSDIEYLLEKYFATKQVNKKKNLKETKSEKDKISAFLQIQWLELFIFEFYKHKVEEIVPILEQNEK